MGYFMSYLDFVWLQNQAKIHVLIPLKIIPKSSKFCSWKVNIYGHAYLANMHMLLYISKGSNEYTHKRFIGAVLHIPTLEQIFIN